MEPTLHICLLGDFLVHADDTPLPALNIPRIQTLLTFLVLKRNAPQPRRRLAFLLWPTRPRPKHAQPAQAVAPITARTAQRRSLPTR